MARNKKRTRKIVIKAPKHYDPGKGRPIEELAYISPREKRALLNSTDFKAEMTKHGILSFADDSASSVGGSNAVSRGDASQGTKSNNPGGSNTGSQSSSGGMMSGGARDSGSTGNKTGGGVNTGGGAKTGGGNPAGGGGANAGGGGMMSGGARDSGSTGNKTGGGVNTGGGANAGGQGGLLGGNRQQGSGLGAQRSMESGFGARPAASPTGPRGPLGAGDRPSLTSPSGPAGGASRALLGAATQPQTQLSRQRELESGYGVKDAARPVDRLDPNRPVGLPQVGYQPERSILSPQAKALNRFVETIGLPEGTIQKPTGPITDPNKINPYDVTFGFGQYAQPPKPPSEMTLRELTNWQREVLNPATGKINTSAVGIAQMQPGTIEDAAKRLGYDMDTTTFSPEVQKNLALETAKMQGVKKSTWASLDTEAERATAKKAYNDAIGYRDAIKGEIASYGGSPPKSPSITGDPNSRAPAAAPRSPGSFSGDPEPQSPFSTYNLEPEQAPFQSSFPVRPAAIGRLPAAPKYDPDYPDYPDYEPEMSGILPQDMRMPYNPLSSIQLPSRAPQLPGNINTGYQHVITSPVMGMPDIPRSTGFPAAPHPMMAEALTRPPEMAPPQLGDLQRPAYGNPTNPMRSAVAPTAIDRLAMESLPELEPMRGPKKYGERIIGDEEIELAREALPPDEPTYQNPPRSFANIPQRAPQMVGQAPVDLTDMPDYSGEPINLTQQENWPSDVKPTTGMPGNTVRQPMNPQDPVAIAMEENKREQEAARVASAARPYTTVQPETDMSETATQRVIARYGEDGVEIARLVNLVNSATGKRGDSSYQAPRKRLPIPMLEA